MARQQFTLESDKVDNALLRSLSFLLPQVYIVDIDFLQNKMLEASIGNVVQTTLDNDAQATKWQH